MPDISPMTAGERRHPLALQRLPRAVFRRAFFVEPRLLSLG